MIKKVFFLVFLTIIFTTTNCSPVQNDTSKQGSTTSTPISTTAAEVPIGLAVGNRAPELEFKSPDGKIITLSSLAGKIVLIDFWASWCAPCRVENPNLVRTYQQFKDSEFKVGKGFTIYSVSLDKQKERWVGAIESDNLSWQNHVSDLRGWESVPAAMYQVHSIPGNFLIDGKGIIIATSLRGESLGLALKALLK